MSSPIERKLQQGIEVHKEQLEEALFCQINHMVQVLNSKEDRLAPAREMLQSTEQQLELLRQRQQVLSEAVQASRQNLAQKSETLGQLQGNLQCYAVQLQRLKEDSSALVTALADMSIRKACGLPRPRRHK